MITQAAVSRAVRGAIKAHRDRGYEVARTVTTVWADGRVQVDVRDKRGRPLPSRGGRNPTRRNEWFKKRGAEDPAWRLSRNVSKAIWKSLRGAKSASWQTLVGYTRAELRAHLEARFVDGMTWENMGRWHIDHIRPLSSFRITGPDCPEFRAAWALSNLQPLWAVENLRKGAKF